MSRRKFQGVTQIIRFNWPFYVFALAVLIAGGVIAARLPIPWRQIVLVGIAAAGFWILISLAVSFYIYDYAPTYDAAWIRRALPQPPSRWANFHAGLDEFSEILRAAYPATEGTIIDFFAAEMSEPSIHRARRLTRSNSMAADFRALPFPAATFDATFVFFAAHELRAKDSRQQFFSELHRITKSNGHIVLLEHLRDWPNFFAFGPGAFHFHSRSMWLRAAHCWTLTKEFSLNPFTRVFVFQNV